MRLFEFDNSGAMISKIIALTNQLKQDLDNGKLPEEYTVDDLLDYFQLYDVILDVNDLYNMIKVPPLNGLITNIQGDSVIFKGRSENDAPDVPDENKNKDIVAGMAKKAMKF